jgi:predicted nucleotidyltransferase
VIYALDQQNRVIVEQASRAFNDVIAVYRFGSSTQGTATTASDAAIALLTPSRTLPGRRFDVQEDIAARIGCDVDLVDLAVAGDGDSGCRLRPVVSRVRVFGSASRQKSASMR